MSRTRIDPSLLNNLNSNLNLGSNKITGLADGTTTTDAATFGQVQNIATNILINGGFEFWQRGSSFSSPASNVYTSDHWFVLYDGTPTFTISQETSLIDSGRYALKLNITAAGGSGFLQVRQLVENYLDYAGKPLALRARVKSNVAGTQIRWDDGVTSFISSAHSGGGSYETLTVTGTMNASPSKLQITLGVSSSNPAVSTIYFDSVMLVIGSTAIPFVPQDYGAELLRCQRYCRVIGGSASTESVAMLQCDATTQAIGVFRFPVDMYTAPTITVNNQTNFSVRSSTGSDISCTTLTTQQITPKSFRFVAGTAGSLAAGNATELLSENTNATVVCSAELS